jgi:integrase/recombinase XerD
MPPARTPPHRRGSIPGYQATTSTRQERAACDLLPGHPLARHIDDFLTDLANANKPRNTIRAYRGDLIAFAAHHGGEIAPLTAAPVRAFLGEIAGQAPATRKRKRAAVASFCKWAVRHELLDASPMDRIDAIEIPRTLPRPAAAADITAVLNAICSRRPRKDVPLDVLRDRVLFETAYACGARASEVCAMYVEDPDLRPDDEHARIHGKGGTVRTVLLDDRGYVALIRLYLARAGCTASPLFRASINGQGGQLSYDAAHNRWKKYCAVAGGEIGIRQLRHAHATQFQQRRVHRGRPPPPRSRLHRDHPGLHPARRQGRRRRDPHRTPQTRGWTPVTEPGPVPMPRLSQESIQRAA